MPAVTPIFLEDLEREHSELIAWLTDYHHAVSQGVGRNHLLAIFDATRESVKKYFRSVEALFEQAAWPYFEQNRIIHCRITDTLDAYRIRLAGRAPMDAVECARALDATLIQLIREQPQFNRLYARIECAHRDESWAATRVESVRLRRQPWKT
jgi:hemerythrin